uniref:Putative toll-like receptor 13 n=2 Tax=Nyssomyia neivai TaxID=330878 RepID=A0A1L8E3B1_9DIPT
MGPSGRDLLIFAIFVGTLVRVIQCPDTVRRRQRHVVTDGSPDWAERNNREDSAANVNYQGQPYRDSSHNLDSKKPTNSIPDRLVDELLVSADNSAQIIDHFASPVTGHTLSPRVDSTEIDSNETTDETITPQTEDYEDSRETYVPDLRHPDCILGPAEIYLSWWLRQDGSLRTSTVRRPENSLFLDLSSKRLSESKIYEKIIQRLQERQVNNFPIVFLSIAKNGLTRIPFESLQLVTGSLEYLSLTGNSMQIMDVHFYSESTVFPALEQLKELDVRRCSIEIIGNNAFMGLKNLRKLYLSHNRIIQLSSATFISLPLLMHLDVSFNTPELWETPAHMTAALERAIGGIRLASRTFEGLKKLKFLDFSHTRVEASSTNAFSHLPPLVQQLSLCHTGVQIIGYGMFNGTNLQVLDISGNPQLTSTMRANTFEGLEDKLEILSFQDSNVKHLSWLQHLPKLRMLMLRGNNINQLANSSFIHTPQLEILDLSANHIGNWYTRVFGNNRLLRILNLRENNINMMTTQMLDDFERLEFLGLGKNDFICSCILREFIDLAANNNRPINCTFYVNPMPDINDFLIEEAIQQYHENIDQKRTRRSVTSEPNFDAKPHPVFNQVHSHENDTSVFEATLAIYDLPSRMYYEYVKSINSSYANMIVAKTKYDLFYISQAEFERLGAETQKNGFRAVELKEHENCTQQTIQNRMCPQRFQPRTTTEIIFTFQLLDFQENDYRCINSSTNREHFFSEIESCLGDKSNWSNLVQSLRQANNSLVTILIVAFVLLTIFCFGYYKWWYIRYFLIIIKNATILSFLDKEKEKVRQGNSDDSFMYDVFVSFCDENRAWVLEELLPNIEGRREISVCMHERDFQVGVSILENIISCMDRSRCLLLVISQSFLLSQWCQFEMHLAQHRLLETCREQLVLILLEDVPKRKRPKTLQFLMRTKTYIRWPTPGKRRRKERQEDEKEAPDKSLQEERKLFWKRLRRALIANEWENDSSTV